MLLPRATTRRDLLAKGLPAGAALLLAACGHRLPGGGGTGEPEASRDGRAAAGPAPAERADYTLRIARGSFEAAPGRQVTTTLYNGQFPGPLLRFRAGRRTVVDVFNDTGAPELVHWHGQTLPVAVDGAAEEGSPVVPAHGMRRLAWTPGPAGVRFYHTHAIARGDLQRGQYSGQVGPVYIEPRREPGAWDQEVFLVLKEFQPAWSQGGDMDMDFLAPGGEVPALRRAGEAAMQASLAKGMPKGYEAGYSLFTVNGRALGHGEPIRVRQGQRVLLHVINASATEMRSLALPRHSFTVVALDGNPVPVPARVPVLWIGTAERVSAVVEMDQPGVWVLGDLDDDDRGHGMGVVVEYAGRTGSPVWEAPPPFKWDYARFALPAAAAATAAANTGSAAGDPSGAPERVIEMTFAKQNAADHGFNVWTINGQAFSMARGTPRFQLEHGRRYRWRMRNESDDIHPVHLHRQSFELTRFAGRPTGGLIKDVVMLGGYQELEVDLTAEQTGLLLFHCHMQLHMDFGFMGLFECAGAAGGER